jgi:hypothetical protein
MKAGKSNVKSMKAAAVVAVGAVVAAAGTRKEDRCQIVRMSAHVAAQPT